MSIPKRIAFLLGILIVILLLFPKEVRYRVDTIKANYDLLFSEREGQIILDAPQLFTRGRLVNDRAIESAWLTEQLFSTREHLKEHRFAKPKNIELATQRLGLVFGGELPTDAQIATLDRLHQFVPSLVPGPDPLDEFESARRYREAIRHARMATVLDDRHDIDGNTIYRLNFGATVLPQRGTNRPAVIEVSIHSPKAKNQATAEQQAIELMSGWVNMLQDDLNKIIADRSTLIEREIEAWDPVEAFKFRTWLENRICLAIPGTANPGGSGECLAEGKLLPASRLLDEMLVRDAAADRRAVKAMGECASIRIPQQQRALGEMWQCQAQAFDLQDKDQQDAMLSRCQVISQQPLRKAFTEEAICRLREKNIDIRADTIQMERIQAEQIARNSQMYSGSPAKSRARPSLTHAISVLDALNLVNQEKSRNPASLNSCLARIPDFIALLEATLIAPNFFDESTEPGVKACQEIGRKLFESGRRYTDPKPRQRKIIAEFALHDLLYNTDLRPVFKYPEGERPLMLNDLVEVRDQEWNCEVGPCEPAIKLKSEFLKWSEMKPYSWQGVSGKESADGAFRHPLLRLIDDLTSTFTYEVIPYSKTIPTISATRSETDMVAKGPGEESAGVSSNTTRAGFHGRPEIIGFGDWGQEKDLPDRNITKFGWVVFPEPDRYVDDIPGHLAESHTVSAMISVPGWWRNIRLDINTCWLRDAGHFNAENHNAICDNSDISIRGPSYSHSIRLPDDARLLNQSLGVNVVKYPYVFRNQAESTQNPTVEVGRPAEVVVRGGRLWRSPVVKLGAQQTTLVEVLPDMMGIIAKFECILPSPGTPGRKERDSSAANGQQQAARNQPPAAVSAMESLYVITSEGITQALPVNVRPFSRRLGDNDDQPCWAPKKQ